MKLFATLALLLVSAAAAAVPAKRQAPGIGQDGCNAAKWSPLLVGKKIILPNKCVHGTHNNVFYAKELPEGTRIIPPGTPVTADYRFNRLNLEVTSDYIGTKVWCG
ncbi:hypothetical protein EC988_000763 [Linderina pennispora]|nr:hypothetical protein EC988_000763 [Linderina pennispora]